MRYHGLFAPALPCPLADLWFNGWREIAKATRPLGSLEGAFISALVQRKELAQSRAFAGDPIMIPEEGPLSKP